LAWVLSRKVQSMLFGLTGADPGIVGTAVVLLAAAGLVAAYFPARRAARIDPMTALRHE
jgi:ABC-type antimicrobial peptide transport system permease subunit